ncbi:MAG: T9SS type A sorting domain-containing protein, partial [Bacteroidota bacterium]
INTNGTVLSSTSPTGNQWYLNGVAITGATGVSHNMNLTGAGTYTVVVTNANGCSSTSLPYLYTGMENTFANAGISMYPVPASEFLMIDFDKAISQDAVSFKIYDVAGSIKQNHTIGTGKNKLDVSALSAGSYLVEVEVNGQRYRQNLVIVNK